MAGMVSGRQCSHLLLEARERSCMWVPEVSSDTFFAGVERPAKPGSCPPFPCLPMPPVAPALLGCLEDKTKEA